MNLPFRLMSYNPQWQQEFEQTRSSLLQATEGWIIDVRHIGGTSLLDSVARPVVDVLAGIEDMTGLNEASMLIEGLNYRRLETPAWCENELCALLHKPRAGDATHTVLLAKHQGPIWLRTLAISEHLQSHWPDRQRLQNIKLDNFQSDCQAESRYAAAKHQFFSDLECGT